MKGMKGMEGMVDMKMSAKERKAMSEPAGEMERPEYPYGLNLRLENDQLEKLGMKMMPKPGEMFEMHAMAKVTSAHESVSEGNKGDRGVQVQITHMMVQKGGKHE